MTIQERMKKAQEEMARVQAIADVYEIIENEYHYKFCEHKQDENGNFLYDENSNGIWIEKDDDDMVGYPWYDIERTIKARDMMREVLALVANMK